MASRRQLKKDITYITEEVIIDALTVANFYESEEDADKIIDVIIDLSDAHNDYIKKVSNFKGKKQDKAEVKKVFTEIVDGFLASCNDAYEKLEPFIK